MTRISKIGNAVLRAALYMPAMSAMQHNPQSSRWWRMSRLRPPIDFLAMPFNEQMLLRIASAYEGATHHRISPSEFGSLNKTR